MWHTNRNDESGRLYNDAVVIEGVWWIGGEERFPMNGEIPDAVDWIVVTTSPVSFQRRIIVIFKYDLVNKQNEQLMNH